MGVTVLLSSQHHHTCFANITSLNFTKSLKPNPPSFFGLQSVSQFFQWIFLRSPHCPHQNFRINISISRQSPKGNLKHPIAKVGMAYTTAFKSTSFPAWESSFSFHSYNFPHTLSFM
ncbi:hypothetical protein RGQ29_009748 [Quercus rubra]|uniref:Uncharacterized protein n=1 Tax=Quercus rubra TaxID=3512 RepID=A0AAN7FYP4_QUERU|nr:hypothetical protein RGQ29_009748 [Quercus rubra]